MWRIKSIFRVYLVRTKYHIARKLIGGRWEQFTLLELIEIKHALKVRGSIDNHLFREVDLHIESIFNSWTQPNKERKYD